MVLLKLGFFITDVTYDSNNGDNSYVFKDNKENNLLLDGAKKMYESTGAKCEK